ncbi:hypothetical protein SAMD00023353_0500280 [Rosellinia necatrix]|uniref:Uncharacterized protein n=1 Tax=Rosellinia necatrix TaxID=77044 RepID=A0A1S8A5R9_ROSNE|nr:hypothetical protein SAMD00023353_0500280 [Rosellinia necatrix]
MDHPAITIDPTTVFKTGIRDSRTEYRRSIHAEFSRESASACVTACFNRLIPSLEDACRRLQQPEHQQTGLWDLYCCDSVNCGVYIGDIGQSRELLRDFKSLATLL